MEGVLGDAGGVEEGVDGMLGGLGGVEHVGC